MRVGIASYPMLFQRAGGLQIQVRETIAALNRLGSNAPRSLQVELVDPNRERLDRFDVIHVFSAINGNYRIVEAAHEQGVPVVLSPLVSPTWDRFSGWRARLANLLAGHMTAWGVQTSYAQTKRALQLAHRIIVLGEAENNAIVSGFLIDATKIHIVPNGIGKHFFTAEPNIFHQQTGIAGPFVLMVGSINPYKNQLGLVSALAGLNLPIVFIGRVATNDHAYLQMLLQLPGVHWLGELQHEDPLLASAYRAASVVALPSQGEVFPLTVLEALAAGTPVVMTDKNALDLPGGDIALRKVAWHDGAALRKGICDFMENPPQRGPVQALVGSYTWERVASEIANCYFELAPLRDAEQGSALHGATAFESDCPMPMKMQLLKRADA